MKISASMCFTICLLFTGCHLFNVEKDINTRNEAKPQETLSTLLELHGLKGKQPEERTDQAKNKIVSPSKLEHLFVDFNKHKPFIRDLYIGFVTGAVARYQTRLFVKREGNSNTAEVSAGKATIVMQKKENNWFISLEQSIPSDIKTKALEEYTRYQSAKVN